MLQNRIVSIKEDQDGIRRELTTSSFKTGFYFGSFRVSRLKSPYYEWMSLVNLSKRPSLPRLVTVLIFWSDVLHKL